MFQSLRVLQEGEGEDDSNEEALSEHLKVFKACKFKFFYFLSETHDVTETCVKTSVLTTLSAGSCIILFILTGSLLAALAKLRYRKKESGLYDAYINHKGQID